ncbi:MAG: hypothetical protein CM15mP79_2390 [Methanobacteriota archaeon]|nr:MAG: hypothetical protein CM15mP79_2390 [Euryarchaeota archaeon]
MDRSTTSHTNRSPGGYTENAASQGEWTYTFPNVTLDAFGEQQAEIRIELIAPDGARKSSQKFRFFFVVGSPRVLVMRGRRDP